MATGTPNYSKRVLIVEGEATLPMAKALASDTRQIMLSLLTRNVMNVSEIAEAMNMPHSTVSFNLNQLEAVGLIKFEVEPGTRGSQKLCAKRYDELLFRLPGAAAEVTPDVVTVSMPIGSYRHVEATSTCGLASETKIIGMLDDPRSFFEPEHLHAQLLWFGKGYVEYAFPNNLPHGATAKSIELSMEICSEAPQYNEDWPSDITLWINGVDIGTWTSPGDMGGTPGLLTPSWWHEDQTTHGLLKRWSVTAQGSMIDGVALLPVTLEALNLGSSNHIKVRIGIKDDARHQGGLNLFGRRFGNYPQDLVMRIAYEFTGETLRAPAR
ncbi:ArsR/SmtB family transcription factor [Rhodoferax sp.]|uniref:ArsR/SmtB family transcription factor n=1 Tax=Rhodoferax sp. TaxID=50421 RepID=UPI00374DABAD